MGAAAARRHASVVPFKARVACTLSLPACAYCLCCAALLTTQPPAVRNACFPAYEQLKGVCSNLEFLRVIAADPRYPAGDTTTKFVEGLDYAPHAGERGILNY